MVAKRVLKITIVVVLIVRLTCYLQFTPKLGRIVTTMNGLVQGVVLQSRSTQNYYAWYGIPYAKPPVGELRFLDPQLPNNWTETRDGTKPGPACAQINFAFFLGGLVGSEDCLNLNVFVPSRVFDVTHIGHLLVPILVYIHGGAFVFGSSNDFGPDYFMDENVILVTINYRLNILGFLSTGDEVLRGNAGLKDQIMALQWIQQNILAFGGNSSSVTIYGNSAGGASVHQLMLSPMAKGLFHKAFSQSGAASNPWALLSTARSLEKTIEIATKFNCPNSSAEIVQCLQQVPVDELVDHKSSFWKNYFLYYPHESGDAFAPIVEVIKDSETFMPEHPLELAKSGRSNHVPWIVGFTTHEGLIGYKGISSKPANVMEVYSNPASSNVKMLFQLDQQPEKVQLIWDFYFPSFENATITHDEKVDRLIQMFGDGFFNFDVREAVNYHRQFAPVYYYLHNKTDQYDWLMDFITIGWDGSDYAVWQLIKAGFNYFFTNYLLGETPKFMGIGHAVDIIYYGPLSGLDFCQLDSEHYEYSRDLVHMLATFMENDSNITFRGTEFLPTPTSGMITALEFKNTNATIFEEPFADRMQFLHSLEIRP